MGGELNDLNMENQEKPIPMSNPVEMEEIQFCFCTQITQAVYCFIDYYLCRDCYDHLDSVERDLYDDLPRHFLCEKTARIRVSHCKMGNPFRGHEERDGAYQNFSEELFVNHPELYNELLYRYCVRLTQHAYYSVNGSLCQDCYYDLDPDDQELYEESKNHYSCKRSGYIQAAYCGLCDIRIAQLQDAITCSECIEEYLELMLN
ncbi:uncharacterized protein LOC122577514 [Bombus pyrosoma]|uniref:uncharacterized protein LOC122577514 n=1 Tax=Bombus pyrosoma TaxID=396416 RepID=UPI001CB9767D|nr:uncharacterized protein LOC122577514 [Bombus pyrosoma]